MQNRKLKTELRLINMENVAVERWNGCSIRSSPMEK